MAYVALTEKAYAYSSAFVRGVVATDPPQLSMADVHK